MNKIGLMPSLADAYRDMTCYGLAAMHVTSNAVAETAVRNFPESRHRSKRIHKKLVKRFGGEFRVEPAAFETPHGLIIHPVLFKELMEATL